MKLPLQISFRNMNPSPAVEARVREKARKLDRFFDQIMSCRVVVEQHHRHHHKGNLYHVRVDLTVPDGELVVNREPDDHRAHEDVYVAVRNAFDAIQRRIEDYARRRRGDVKHHETPPHGRIVALENDHGTIVTSDGREIYFHRNSVIDADFNRLKPGDEVRFAEEAGMEGPHASTVRRVGKHHLVG